MCASHCAQLLHTILHRTDLIVFPLTLQTNHCSDDVYLREGGKVKCPIYLPNLVPDPTKKLVTHGCHTTTTTTVLRPFFWDHPGEPVPEENFWTLCCKGRLTEADALTIQLGATPSGLTSAHLHHPHFFAGRMPFLPPNQQSQSTEGN